jgi:two-component system sensor histidine kinase VicK
LAAAGPLVYFCYRPADRRVVYVSSNYARVLGGNPAAVNDELPGWLEAVHPDDRTCLAERLRHAATSHMAEQVQVRLARPDGGTRWLALTATGLRAEEADGGALLTGYVQDVTPSQAQAEHTQRYLAKKDLMLEVISHDLASPLAMAQQMTDYLAEKVEPLQDPHLNSLLDTLRASCEDGVTLIRDFVSQEFLESTHVDLQLTRLDLAERLRRLLETYEKRPQSGHYFRFEATHLAVYAEVDENKFLQVVNNLLGNAMKFTPDGGTVTVRVSQHPAHVLVTVSDTGIGIPAALQEGLFERFTPARRPGLRGEKTNGLGMSIVKTIVELHRGSIWFESQENVGSSFYIRLPLPAA